MAWNEVAAASAWAEDNTSSPWVPSFDPIDAGEGQIVFVALLGNNNGIGPPTFALDKPSGETGDWVWLARIIGGSTSNTATAGSIFGIIVEKPGGWSAFSPTVTITSQLTPPGPLLGNWAVWEGGSLLPRWIVGHGLLFPPQWIPANNANPTESQTTATLDSYYQPRGPQVGPPVTHGADLAIGMASVRTGTVPTQDPDTTNGPWLDVGDSAGGLVIVGGTEDIAARMATKVPTATSNQTLDMVTANKSVLVALCSQEVISVVQQRVALTGTLLPRLTLDTASLAVDPGDIILAAAAQKAAGTQTIDDPAGYTPDRNKVSGVDAVQSTRMETFHKIADGTEPNTTDLTIGAGSTPGIGGIVRLRAASPTLSVDIQSTIAAGAIAAPLVADQTLDLRPGDVLVYMTSSFRTLNTPTFTLTGITFRQYPLTGLGTSGGTDIRMEAGFLEIDTGTATVTPSVTITSGSGSTQAVVGMWRIRPTFAPFSPIDLTCVTPTGDSLTFEWTFGGGPAVDGYEVRIDGGAAVDVGTDTDHTFTGLTEGSTHTLEVRAYNEDGFSDWSSIECTTLSGVPTDLNVFTCTGVSLELCYTAADGSPDYYEVRIDGGTPVNVGTDLCHTFTGLDPNTSHLLEARACITDTGCSDWVGVTGITSPGPPTDLSATSTTTSVELCWIAPAGGADTYEARIDGSDTVTGITDLCQAFEGLTASTSYLLEVRACNDCGCSDWVPLEVETAQGRSWSPCPCGTQWNVEVCDLRTGIVRGVLLPVGMDWQTLLNLVGQGTLTLPVRSLNSPRNVWPRLTSVYITRDGADPESDDCVWAGILEQFSATSTLGGGTVMVGMKSIEHYLWRRKLRTDLTYTDQPPTNIAASLVNYTLTNGIPLTGEAETSAYTFTRAYDADTRPWIGDLISQLTQAENGPSWRLVHSRVNGRWSTRIIFSDTVGSVFTDPLRSDYEGSNYGLDVDATDMANVIDAMNSTPAFGTAQDLSVYPQFDDAPTFDVQDSALTQQAIGYLAQHKEPAAVPSFTIPGSTPAPFDLRLGDTRPFHINQGMIAFHGDARIHGITWRANMDAPDTRELALIPDDPASQSILNATSTDQCPVCR